MNNIEKEHPRILVISYNCFSKSGSNGRTLASFFLGWDKNCVAQFYMANEVPDSDVCDNYFRVTDVDALNALLKGKNVGKKLQTLNIQSDSRTPKDEKIFNYSKKNKKKPVYRVLRDIVWRCGSWRGKDFEKWIDEFNPEIVLLMAHNYSYSFKIALQITKKRNIPLVVYNCEDYYLKKSNTLSPIYKLYKDAFKKAYKKTMKEASHVIYNSEMLKKSFSKEFQVDSTVIYTPTIVKPHTHRPQNPTFTVSYLGNFDNGRHESLIEVANTLKEINSNILINVYGTIKSDIVRSQIESCSAISYQGFVNYDLVQEVMHRSDLLIHVENFGEFFRNDLRHGFTTKIPDSLASGTCFFVYAPDDIAGIQYLVKNNAACVCSNPNNLYEKLSKIVESEELRKQYIDNALNIVSLNHSKKQVYDKFYDVIYNVVNKYNKNSPRVN